MSRISVRFLWIAGTRMCDERSPASWTISSARSVSRPRSPPAASASLRPISSVTIDLTLIDLARARLAHEPPNERFASAPSRAQWTIPPARVHRRLQRQQVLVEVAQRRSLMR